MEIGFWFSRLIIFVYLHQTSRLHQIQHLAQGDNDFQ